MIVQDIYRGDKSMFTVVFMEKDIQVLIITVALLSLFHQLRTINLLLPILV